LEDCDVAESETKRVPELFDRRPGAAWVWGYVLVGLGVVMATGVVEWGMGRTVLSKSGAIYLWIKETNSAETSQQLADWYSFTHIIHGILLYGLIWLVTGRKVSVGPRLLLAVVAECAWELLENSDFIINRYREATVSNGYYGDSVLNSVADILFCAGGFLMARLLPVRVTILLVVVMEIGLAWAIRDNLTLNIIMLLHPFSGIKQWQMGAG
jgi:hypothetical protein